MGFLDNFILFIIIFFGIILLWSAYQKQRIINTLEEIKEFIISLKEAA